MQYDSFQRVLQGCCEIGVLLSEIVTPAPGLQTIYKSGIIDAFVFGDGPGGEAIIPFFLQSVDRFKYIPISMWIAIRGKAHDFVLIAESVSQVTCSPEIK